MVRRIVWFSCGAASAVAAKLTVDAHPSGDILIDGVLYPNEVRLVYCNTAASEHPDNYRFRQDVERWTGRFVDVIASEKYANVDEVFKARRYMSGPKGAACTTEMKKIPRFSFQRPDDIHIFGFTANEKKRVKDFQRNNPELRLEWPLVEAGITKDDCYRILRGAKIELPVMYRLGYRNNNCIGCVKASSPAYWNKIRRDFPEVFERRARQSRAIGARLVRVKGERIFLDELDQNVGLFSQQTESVSCGPECGETNGR